MAGASTKTNERLIAWKPQKGPQTIATSCPVEDILFGGARGGGKSDWLMGDWLRHNAEHGPHSKGILFRRTMSELEEIKDRMSQVFPLMGAKYRVQQSVWIMPNGAKLKLRYLKIDQDSENYQGHQYTWLAVDEMGNFPKPNPIDKLRATLRSAEGIPCEFRSTANPGGRGHAWIKERYLKGKKPLTPFLDEEKCTRRIYIPSRLSDNKILIDKDPEYINRIKSSGPAYLVEAWLNGNWDVQPGASLIKEADFRYYDDLPPDIDFIICSMDTAFQTKNTSDFSVCLTAYVAKSGIYIEHVWRDKVEFPELKARAESLSAKFKPHVLLIESAASGQSLIQELRRGTRLPIKPVKPDSDKVTRVNAILPMIDSGNVLLKRGQAWLSDFIDEVTLFPNGAKDDQVDALSQMLNYVRSELMNEPFIMDMNDEEKEEAFEGDFDDFDNIGGMI